MVDIWVGILPKVDSCEIRSCPIGKRLIGVAQRIVLCTTVPNYPIISILK